MYIEAATPLGNSKLKWAWQAHFLNQSLQNLQKFMTFQDVHLVKNHWILTWTRQLLKKFQNAFFLVNISNSCCWVTRIVLKPTQKNFFEKISKNTAARGVQNFGLIEDAAELPLEQSQKFWPQISALIWWTYAENFKWFLNNHQYTEKFWMPSA